MWALLGLCGGFRLFNPTAPHPNLPHATGNAWRTAGFLSMRAPGTEPTLLQSSETKDYVESSRLFRETGRRPARAAAPGVAPLAPLLAFGAAATAASSRTRRRTEEARRAAERAAKLDLTPS